MNRSRVLLIPIIFLSISVLLFGCKKDKGGGDSTDNEKYRPLYEMAQALNDLQNGMMDYSSQGYATKAALVSAAQDLENDANVTSTLQIDSSYVYVTMNSGLQTVYFLSPVDGNGNPTSRGGGNASNSSLRKILSTSCTNEITNKKILLFNAEFNTNSNAREVLNDNKEKFDLEITELKKENCTYDVVSTFGNYGLVVINTHGLPNGFLLGTELPVTIQNSVSDLNSFAEAITGGPSRNIADQILIDKQIGTAVVKYYDPTKPIHEQKFDNADKIATWISAKQIAQFNFSNTIIMGNMCYSGFDNTTKLGASNIPILEGFRQAFTRTYYGYQQTAGISHMVDGTFAESMEANLYRGFFNDGDSTGNVHKQNNGDEWYDPLWVGLNDPGINEFGNLFFRQFFADNYCYEDACGDTIIDGRDQHVYQTVCIGDQRWMAENLNYSDGGTVGVCYDNNSGNCDIYGRLYTIQELTGLQVSTPSTHVQGLCPKGWHVPSKTEFEELIAFCGGVAEAADKLKSANGWPVSHPDTYGFNLLSGGHFVSDNTNSVFQNMGQGAKLWTSSKDGGYYIGVNAYDDLFGLSQYSYPSLIWKFSCRCVED